MTETAVVVEQFTLSETSSFSSSSFKTTFFWLAAPSKKNLINRWEKFLRWPYKDIQI